MKGWIVGFFLFISFYFKVEGEVWNWGTLGPGRFPDSIFPSVLNETQEMEITKISDGLWFWIYLEGNHTLYARGNNFYGQLGVGFVSDYHIFEEFQAVDMTDFIGQAIVDLSAGSYHSVILDDDGRVYTWGRNSSFELGRTGNPLRPQLIPSFLNPEEKIVSVSAGTAFTVLLSNQGKVYNFGKNTFLQFVSGPQQSIGIPTLLEIDDFIVKISAGWRHVSLLTENGTVITYGDNFYGQLGRGASNVSSSMEFISLPPKKVELECTVNDVSSGAFHTIVLCDSGEIYTFGFNSSGQLGRVGERSIPLQLDSSYITENITDVEAGFNHNVLLSESGRVYVNGGSCIRYVRGHSGCQDFALPISQTQSEIIISISAGSFHSSMISAGTRNESDIEIVYPCETPDPCIIFGDTPVLFTPQPTRRLPFVDIEKNKKSILLAWLLPLIFILNIIIVGTAFFVYKKRKSLFREKRPLLEDRISVSAFQLGLPRFPPEEVKILELIGEGKFGSVFKGVLRGTPVALKRLNNLEATEDFIREMTTLGSLSHPNILRILGSYKSQDQVDYLVTEYCEHGNLQEVLRNDRDLSNLRRLEIALQIISGMIYLHDQNVLHRDLGARNCLVKKEGNKYLIKISDFGLSGKEIVSESQIPIRWSAIEVLKHSVYSKKSDVWSFGVLLWEIFNYGKIPYTDFSNLQVVEQVTAGNRLPKSDICTDEIYEVMLQCWKESPDERPNFEQILELISECLRLIKKEMPIVEEKSQIVAQSSNNAFYAEPSFVVTPQEKEIYNNSF